VEQLTKKQAVAIHDSGLWKNWTDEEIVKLQLYQRLLCIPRTRFHEAIEKVLGRPVWTHEFASQENLMAEYEGKRPKPTFEEIVDLLPKDKTIIMVA
jgi:hypothetical protein